MQEISAIIPLALRKESLCMKRWLKRYVDPVMPLYYIVPFLVSVSLNTVVYYVTQWITAGHRKWNMETFLDRRIPVIPEFTVIYFSFFLFCCVNHIVIAHQGKEHAYRFIASDMLSRVICGFFFLVLPTTNIRPDDLGVGLWPDLLRILYEMDQPVNLFPSIHCLASWLCFVSVRSSGRLPRWYKLVTGIFAGLICFSTLAVKQHVLADVAAGILLAEGLLWLSGRICWYRRIENIMEKISCRLFGAENIKESEQNL